MTTRNSVIHWNRSNWRYINFCVASFVLNMPMPKTLFSKPSSPSISPSNEASFIPMNGWVPM